MLVGGAQAVWELQQAFEHLRDVSGGQEKKVF